MEASQRLQDAPVRRYDYDDRTVVVADFGPDADPSVDVVDGTAIVVIGEHQREFDVPAGAVQAINRNGIVTIEVDQE